MRNNNKKPVFKNSPIVSQNNFQKKIIIIKGRTIVNENFVRNLSAELTLFRRELFEHVFQFHHIVQGEIRIVIFIR